MASVHQEARIVRRNNKPVVRIKKLKVKKLNLRGLLNKYGK